METREFIDVNGQPQDAYTLKAIPANQVNVPLKLHPGARLQLVVGAGLTCDFDIDAHGAISERAGDDAVCAAVQKAITNTPVSTAPATSCSVDLTRDPSSNSDYAGYDINTIKNKDGKVVWQKNNASNTNQLKWMLQWPAPANATKYDARSSGTISCSSGECSFKPSSTFYAGISTNPGSHLEKTMTCKLTS